MERDFMGAAGNEQQHQQRQRAAEDDGGSTKESAFFGAGGPPPMDWSFASRAGAAPGVMSFRPAPREEQGVAQFSSTFDGVQKPRVLTQQRSFGADSLGSPQYTAMRGAYSPSQQQQQLQHQRQQHAANGARVIPGPSPFNPNNPMYKVQSSPNMPNGVAAGGTFKQPPFAVNSGAVAASRVGVYARNMPKPKMAQLTIFYAGSVNVFNNVSPEKAQEIMLLASRGSLPSAPSTAARSPEANFFAPAKAAAVAPSAEANFFAPAKPAAPEISPASQMLPQKQQRFSPPAPGISKSISSSMSQPTCLPKSASSINIDSTGPRFSSQLVMPLTSQPPSTRPSSGQSVVPPTSQHPSARPVTLTSSGQPVLPLASQPPLTRPVTLAATTAAATRPVTLAATTAEAIMPRAVPQARKASLARFLEKRKERVTTVAPYSSSSKSPMESNDTAGSSIENTKSSCTGFAISSNSVWRPRNISFGGEPPSTNLHM